jgi:hypothetical protein
LVFSIPSGIKELVFDEAMRPAAANSVAGFIHSSCGRHLPLPSC